MTQPKTYGEVDKSLEEGPLAHLISKPSLAGGRKWKRVKKDSNSQIMPKTLTQKDERDVETNDEANEAHMGRDHK